MNVSLNHEGVWVTVTGQLSGLTFLLPASMTIGAIENNLREMYEWLS